MTDQNVKIDGIDMALLRFKTGIFEDVHEKFHDTLKGPAQMLEFSRELTTWLCEPVPSVDMVGTVYALDNLYGELDGRVAAAEEAIAFSATQMEATAKMLGDIAAMVASLAAAAQQIAPQDDTPAGLGAERKEATGRNEPAVGMLEPNPGEVRPACAAPGSDSHAVEVDPPSVVDDASTFTEGGRSPAAGGNPAPLSEPEPPAAADEITHDAGGKHEVVEPAILESQPEQETTSAPGGDTPAPRTSLAVQAHTALDGRPLLTMRQKLLAALRGVGALGADATTLAGLAGAKDRDAISGEMSMMNAEKLIVRVKPDSARVGIWYLAAFAPAPPLPPEEKPVEQAPAAPPAPSKTRREKIVERLTEAGSAGCTIAQLVFACGDADDNIVTAKLTDLYADGTVVKRMTAPRFVRIYLPQFAPPEGPAPKTQPDEILDCLKESAGDKGMTFVQIADATKIKEGSVQSVLSKMVSLAMVEIDHGIGKSRRYWAKGLRPKGQQLPPLAPRQQAQRPAQSVVPPVGNAVVTCETKTCQRNFRPEFAGQKTCNICRDKFSGHETVSA